MPADRSTGIDLWKEAKTAQQDAISARDAFKALSVINDDAYLAYLHDLDNVRDAVNLRDAVLSARAARARYLDTRAAKDAAEQIAFLAENEAIEAWSAACAAYNAYRSATR